VSVTVFLDPEVRRVLLEEIAFQRHHRGKYREMAAAELEHSSIVFWDAMAEGCNRAIHAIRNVWDQVVAVERRHAENALAVDLADWAPLVDAGVPELELRAMAGDR
jgi:hypothetical protein